MKNIIKKIITTTIILSLVFSSLPNLNTQKAYAQTPPPTTSTGNDSPTIGSCWNGFTQGGFDFSWCVANGLYYIFFVPTSFLFSLAGQLLDFSMEYTLNSANYGKTADGSSFVEKGWTITRDLSNLMFIIILMWIAINIILGIGKDKKLLINIIVVGLLINFSLFFARVLIDASNILGKIFYDSMSVTEETTGNNAYVSEGEKSISVAIVSNFNPQKLFSQTTALKIPNSSGVQGTNTVDSVPFIIITLIMSVINLVGMYVFFVIAFVLIGRVIGLWLLMIFAPAAFISMLIPGGPTSQSEYFNFSKWKDALFSQSFVVPVFLFLLYLILLFMKTGFLQGFRTFDNSTTGGILSVIVPLIIITFLLLKAKDISVKMSGEIGGAFGKVGAAVGGLALGGALGAYGKLGRATIGRAGERIANSETMMNIQRTGGLLKNTWFEGAAKGAAGGIRSGAKATGSASFDARGVSGVTNTLKSAGISDYGSAAKDGYRGYVERQDKKDKDTADELIKGSVNDRTNQDTRRARRNLDVLLQTHGVELSSREETLESARKKFKQVQDDGAKENDGSGVWEAAKKKVDDAKDAVTKFKDDNGISEAGKELGKAESIRKREEEKRKRGQSQEIEATRPKSPKEIEEENEKKKELNKELEVAETAIKDAETKFGKDSAAYRGVKKEKENIEEKIRNISYSKRDGLKRFWRRVGSGSEYNQTGAYGTADNQRKGLKDDKKSDDKK